MASKTHLVIDQGTTFSTDLNLTDDNGDPLVLTGYTANAVIKKWYTSSNSTAFTTAVNTTSGVVTLYLDANTTNNLTAGRYVYDVILTDASNAVSRVVEGIITITPSSSTIVNQPANTNIYPNSAPIT